MRVLRPRPSARELTRGRGPAQRAAGRSAERDALERLVAGAARARAASGRASRASPANATGSGPRRPRRPRRARAGAQPRHRRVRAGTAAARARAARPPRARPRAAPAAPPSAPARSTTSAHSTRARRGGSSSAGPSARSARRTRARAHDVGDARRLASGPVAEEHERDVQRLVGDGPPHGRIRAASRKAASAARAPAGRSRATKRRSVGGPSSSRRSRCIATVVVRSRTIARLPGSWTVAVDPRPVRARPRDRQTVPTGLASRAAARPGDARDPDPDVRARARAIAPSASADRHLGRDRAVALDQRRRRRPPATPWPRWSRRSAPPSTYAEEPARSVSRAGHQPAGARLGDRDRAHRRAEQRRRHQLVDRLAVAANTRRAVALEHGRLERARSRRRPPGSKTVAISISPAPQAGRDLQRARAARRRPRPRAASWRSRTRAARTAAGSAARRPPAPASAACSASVSSAVSHIGCSSPGGPGSTDHRHAVGRARPGRARSRPARARSRPRAPSPACGCRRAARPRRSRRASAPAAARGSRRSGPPAPRRAASRGRRTSATTSAVRSSAVGPRPPLVMITSTPSRGQELQRGAQVLRAVADDRHVRELRRPRSRSRSASHGPLRSAMIPDRTSVPVTTMPARALTCSRPGRS